MTNRAAVVENAKMAALVLVGCVLGFLFGTLAAKAVISFID